MKTSSGTRTRSVMDLSLVLILPTKMLWFLKKHAMRDAGRQRFPPYNSQARIYGFSKSIRCAMCLILLVAHGETTNKSSTFNIC